MVGWLVGCFVGLLVGWRIGGLVGGLFGWRVGGLVGGFFGWWDGCWSLLPKRVGIVVCGFSLLNQL